MGLRRLDALMLSALIIRMSRPAGYTLVDDAWFHPPRGRAEAISQGFISLRCCNRTTAVHE